MRSGQFVQEKLQFVKDLCKNPPVTDDLGTPEASNAPTALLSFIAQNVRSYRDEVFFSLEATRLANDEVVHSLGIAGLKNPVKALPAAGIFGANASGKSGLLQAMSDMRSIVLHSFRRGDRTAGIRRRPFLLDEETRRQPSRFEIELILKGVRWEYGFEIDDERVLGEYANYYPNGRRVKLFDRDLGEVRFGPTIRTESRRFLELLLHDNVLLLSVADVADSKDIRPLFEWFMRNMMIVDQKNRGIRTSFTADLAHSSNMRHRVLSFLKAADLGVADIKKISPDPDTAERIMIALSSVFDDDSEFDDTEQIVIEDIVNLLHDSANGHIELELEDESSGTMAWVGVIGPVLQALDHGDVLLIDELGASLHPHLVKYLIELFQDTETNPRCAQLIFNSHDTKIMEHEHPRALGRDQLWLTEKLNDGSTTLYSIAEFKTRVNEALERRYLEGRFGGIPCLIPPEVFVKAAEFADS